MPATVTIPLDEYDDLRNAKVKAEAIALDLRKQLAALVDVKIDEAPLAAAIRDLVFPIIQYAVANLPPETNRRWPYQKLKEFGEFIRANWQGADAIRVAEGMIDFAAEVEPYERMRIERGDYEAKRLPPATRADFGARTEEALAMQKSVEK